MGTAVQVTSDEPVAVDREMYWGDGDGSAKYGASLSSAVRSGATSQSFALLPTAGGSQSFITVLNPNSSDTNVSLQLVGAGGGTLKTVSATVNAHARHTFVIQSIAPGNHGYIAATLRSAASVVSEAAVYLSGSPNAGRHPGALVQGSTGIQIGSEADLDAAGGMLQIFNPGLSSVRAQVMLGTLVVSDTTVPAGTARLVQLTGSAAARGLLVTSSGSVTATLLDGALGTAPVWGGGLG